MDGRQSSRVPLFVWGAVALSGLLASPAHAQREPHIGYLYPAGAQAGTTAEIVLGGQHLEGLSEVLITGTGVSATIGKFRRPLTPREATLLRDKIQQAREQLQAEGKKVDLRRRQGAMADFLRILGELQVTEEDLERLEEDRARENDPKRQPNAQLEETVLLSLSLDATAEPGRREVRVRTPAGLSSPFGFHVGQFPEVLEREPNDLGAEEAIAQSLPYVLNGQIMPGDVDRFRFPAKRGQRLVFQVSARELVPYLADAVPGWFQAVVALYDPAGKEVGYADDYRFHPDPILTYRVEQDGLHELEIRDSIYRGREDFVYRITIGELPLLTSVFPLGVQQGTSTTVALSGWNLPSETLVVDAADMQPGRHPLSVVYRKHRSNEVPFVVDTLPEFLEQEPNNTIDTAQPLTPPGIVNGRVDQPGDWDVYRFDGRAGGQVMVEVMARRLDSPLDSVLKLTDAQGTLLLINDDFVDAASGLVTHHADSQLHITLPADGTYFIHVGDVQNKGGPAYAYRLRVSARQPDFALRVVPPSVNARPGTTVPLTLHAVRRDGFDQDIEIRLKNPPAGFQISGGWVPADQDKITLTLTVPDSARDEPYRIELEGRAEVRGEELVRRVVPAAHMMQAFIYFHLVPADDLMVYVSGRAAPRSAVTSIQPQQTAEQLLKIPSGSMVRYPLVIPNRANLNDVGVELHEPPDGITVVRVLRESGRLVMLLSADAELAKPGLKGNLVFNVFVERQATGRDGRPGARRRVPLGSFPAVPFEVVAR